MKTATLLCQANTGLLDEGHCWVLRPGMRFGAAQKWWGDLGRRDYPHEGVDFCLFRDASGALCAVDHTFRIPAFFGGTIKGVFGDYLGQAVIVEHHRPHDPAVRLISIYAHTRPGDHIRKGAAVNTGDIIATVADTRTSKAAIRPHLHYTLGTTNFDFDCRDFVWNDMRDPEQVGLIDPLDHLDVSICPQDAR